MGKALILDSVGDSLVMRTVDSVITVLTADLRLVGNQADKYLLKQKTSFVGAMYPQVKSMTGVWKP
jgi:hypothetical protein